MKRRRNPDDEGLLARLSIRVDDYPAETRGRKGNFKQVNAYEEGVLVARFLFKLLRKYAEAKDVAVIPDLQRRGVASWLYRWVERKYGVKVIHSKDQTTDGRAFARGRRRNPDDRELLSRLSLTLEHHGRRRIGDGRTLPVVDVKVLDGSRQVGAFLFVTIGDAIEAVDAYVNPSVRRRGVASWVYREVGRHFGTTVRHSKLQLEAGRAFARGRRR